MPVETRTPAARNGGTTSPPPRRHPPRKYKSLHESQKPLDLIEITVLATNDAGDTVWEPFGGLCPAAICAFRLGRASHSAEIVSEFYHAAVERLNACHESLDLSG